tara:strand:+ start:70 stop:258 length:189 start_codon:yes stop_codon:yes gene_type:complete
MFNFVFDVQHEWFKYIYRGADTSLSHLIKLYLKVFANIMAISLTVTMPIAFMMLGANYLGLL